MIVGRFSGKLQDAANALGVSYHIERDLSGITPSEEGA